MRYLILILSVFILFLAVKPGIETLLLHVDTEQGCCGGVPVKSDTEKCTQDLCNPFHVCKTCGIAFINTSYTFDLNPEFNSENNFIYQLPSYLKFLPEFWQPPRIV